MNAVDLKRLLGVKENRVPETLQEAYPQLAQPGELTSRGKALVYRQTVRLDAR